MLGLGSEPEAGEKSQRLIEISPKVKPDDGLEPAKHWRLCGFPIEKGCWW